MWPLVVYGLCRWLRLSWRAMGLLFAGLAFGSAALMAVLFERAGVTRVYYGTDTRAQALLIGAALAVAYLAKGQPERAARASTNRAISLAALAGVGVTAWLWSTAGDGATWLYQGGYLLAAVAIAVVLTSVVRPRAGVLGAVLSIGAVRWIGQISYGLYLWHWPVYVVLTTDRTGLDDTPLLLVRLAVTFAVATASYYLVELPVRRGALRGWRGFALGADGGRGARRGVVARHERRPAGHRRRQRRPSRARRRPPGQRRGAACTRRAATAPTRLGRRACSSSATPWP